MLKLFNFFVDLCLLRRKPQDLSASFSLFVVVLSLNVIVGAIGVADIIKGPVSALAAAMLDAVLAIIFLRMLLFMKGHTERFLQTATALFGASAVLNLVALPLALLTTQSAEGEQVTPMGAILYLFLLIWIQVVIGHIIRHALDVTLFLGVGLALTYSLMSGFLIQALFLN